MIKNAALMAFAVVALAASSVFAEAVNEVHVPKSAWDKLELSKAKAGDFAEYEMPAVAGMKTRQEVVEIGDHTMTMSTSMTMAGNKMPAQKMKMIYDGPEVAGKDPKTNVEMKEADDKVTIAKGTYDAKRYEAYQDGKLLSKSWMSKDVPVTGLVKTQGPDGKDTMVLVDFGRGK